MGAWFEFTCGNCGYSAEVSGGKDCGMICVVETMVCQTCRELVDVVIEGDPINYLAYDEEKGSCPKCHGKDVSVWQEPWPCPKCGGQMARGQQTAIWD